MEFIKNNKKLISIIILSLIIYVRCDYGVTKSYAIAMNVVMNLIGILYCLILTTFDFKRTRESIFNLAILWLVIFQALVFIYGHFNLYSGNNGYSMQYTLLTIAPALLCYEILWHNTDDIIEILSVVGVILITATFITGLISDPLWLQVLEGRVYRLGSTPGASVIDVGNLYMLMLIPIFYSIIILRRIKQYIVFAGIGVVGILLAGAKSSAIPVVIVVAIMLFSTAKNPKEIRKYLVGIVIVVAAVGIISMTVPVFYRSLGSRFVELFTSFFDGGNHDLHTSSGQRLAVIDAFKEHFGESPIFGHGFYSFITKSYSKLEEYRLESGEIAYRNIQIHMNFLELLFSYGILGFVLYYWYPVKLVIDTIKSHDREIKLICTSLLISIFFMDLGLDMYYKYMVPCYTYLLTFTMLKKENG